MSVTPAQAAAELDAMAKRLAIAYPASDKGNHVLLWIRAGALLRRTISRPRQALPGLSLRLPLPCWSFVHRLCRGMSPPNLLLAQASSRQKEMAVRLALGASRGQLVRQMLAESTLLALAGGMLGFTLSVWATSALSSFRLPAPVPLDVSLTQDWRVSLYTFVLSLGAGLLFGVAPAWAVSRPLLTSALKGEDALARPGERRLESTELAGGPARRLRCRWSCFAPRDSFPAQPAARGHYRYWLSVPAAC